MVPSLQLSDVIGGSEGILVGERCEGNVSRRPEIGRQDVTSG